MLILSRRIGQFIYIGEGESRVAVSVLSVKGNQVRLGVDAPRKVPVHREEIYERIQQERAEAAAPAHAPAANAPLRSRS